MKRFLLSLAVCAGFSAMAQDVVFDFAENDYGLTRLSGNTTEYIEDGTTIINEGVTLKFTSAYGAESSNFSGCRLWSGGMRMYNGGIITVTADKNITGVAINPTSTSVDIKKGENSWTLAYTATSKYERVATLTVSFGDSTPENPGETPSETSVKSVKETIALATKTEVKIDYALTVGFVSNRNVFACDEAGDFIQLYGSNTLEAGDVIPGGWTATYELYNGVTPELTGFSALPEATKGTFVAKEVSVDKISNDLVNSVVMLKNVVFDAETPSGKENFTGKVGDVELSFRNNYSIPGVVAGTYNVTFVVTVYNGAPSLYVIKYESAQSGVNVLGEEASAPVYYNLQGVKVANPENGIYIVRRGNKVSKEIVR